MGFAYTDGSPGARGAPSGGIEPPLGRRSGRPLAGAERSGPCGPAPAGYGREGRARPRGVDRDESARLQLAMAYAEILSALSDATRRGIYEELTAAPRTVGELARDRPISRPAVSQHLKVLEAAGLVSVTPQGTARVYAVVPAGLAPLRAYVEDLWSDALQSYARQVIRQGSDGAAAP